MAEHDGDGWAECRCGSRHWGRHGAAGLVLLRDAGTADGPRLLLQLRAAWTHQGGTWGVPGGARDGHEDVVAAALREAREETGLGPGTLQVLGTVPGTDHGDWSYTYVVATALPDAPEPHARTSETDALSWTVLDRVPRLPLHPGLRGSWPGLLRGLAGLLPAGPAGG